MYRTVRKEGNICKSIANPFKGELSNMDIVAQTCLEFDNVMKEKMKHCRNDKFSATCIKNHLVAVRTFINYVPDDDVLFKIKLLNQAVLYARTLPTYFEGTMPGFLFIKEH